MRGLALLAVMLPALLTVATGVLAQGEPEPVPQPASTVAPAAAEPMATPAIVVPPPPDDVPGAKAYAVLDRACASCHQVGRLDGAEPEGRLGDILDLAAIAADPSLVRPGLPEASRVYDVILSRHAPLQVQRRSPERDKGDKSEKSDRERDKEKNREKDEPKDVGEPPNWPGASDALIVREWIERLQPTAPVACPGRSPITPEETAFDITRAIGEASAERQAMLRVVSLVPEFNRCMPEADLESARQAITRLVNSLSWAGKIAVPKRIGREGTLLMFDLGEIGWVQAHWDRLAAMYPLDVAVDAPLDAEVVKLAGTLRVVVRGDWLAATATQTRLYYDLIGLPARLADLEQILSVNSQRLVLRRAGVRAGIETSLVTAGPRVLERLPARSGALWRSYDLPPVGKSGDTLAVLPVGPEPVEGVDGTFKPLIVRTLSASPNGLPMFGLFDPQGNRVDRLPQTTDRHGATPAASVLSCLSCHRAGVRGATDALRAVAQKDQTPKAVREAILALHPEQASINTLVGEDQAPVRQALAEAGIDVTRRIRGLDPLVALAAGYTTGGDLDRLLSDSGRSRAELAARRVDLPEDARELMLRVHYGPIGRAEFDRLLNAIAAATGPVADATPPARPAEPGPRPAPTLALWASAATFKSGDLASFTVRSTADCFLTVIGIDGRKIATVLFPNDFEPNNQLVAGQSVTIPSPDAGYQFRLKGKGRETVVALCAPQSRTFAGIEHDFERQRFTVLGTWDVFLAEQLAAGAKSDTPPEPRPRRQKDKDKDKGDKPVPLSLFSAHARAALAYEIE